MSGARHDQAVAILTGHERFVRLVVEREMLLPRDTLPPSFSSASPSPSPGPEKSPRLFGLPKPYSSYGTQNRPGLTASYRKSTGDPEDSKTSQENISGNRTMPHPTKVSNKLQ